MDKIKKILIATEIRFWQNNTGAKKRIFSLYNYLKKNGFKLAFFYVGPFDHNDKTILANNFNDIEIYHSYKEKRTILSLLKYILKIILPINFQDFLHYKIEKKIIRRIKIISYRLRSLNKSVDEPVKKNINSFFSLENKNYFDTICENIKPDFIIAECIMVAYLIEGIKEKLGYQVVTLIDTLDIFFLRVKKFKSLSIPFIIDITEEQEKNILEKFDIIIGIQKQESEFLRKLLPNKKIITASYNTTLNKNAFKNDSRVNITFIAAAGVHNVYSIEKFINDVWISLYKKYKDKISLRIIGDVCKFIDIPSKVKGIVLHGTVENLDTIYKYSDIIINPIAAGTGLKIKNVEALSNKKPLVTTSVGAEGLEEGINSAFFVCDTPEDTIKKLSELIENPKLRDEMCDKAYKFALENFSEEKVYGELYQELIKDF